MGKRGKRRRRHRSAEAKESIADDDREDGDSDKPASLEVVLVGNDEGESQESQFPPPMVLPQQGEAADATRSSSFPSGPGLFSKVWHHMGQSRKAESWTPTIIQRQLWAQYAMKPPRYNCIAIAPTSSGKTLAYAIPTICQQKITKGLVLVPTRELVQQVAKVYEQVAKSFRKVTKKHGGERARIISIYGGVDRQPQIDHLFQSSEGKTTVVVSTPGRLLDLLEEAETGSRTTNSRNDTESNDAQRQFKADWVVLDEADQLAKEGDLGPQVEKIVRLTCDAERTHFSLLSATYPDKAKAYFQKWAGSKHVLIQVDKQTQDKFGTTRKRNLEDEKEVVESERPSTAASFGKIPTNIEQILHVCSDHKKPKKLIHTISTIRKKEANQRTQSLGIVFFAKIEKLKFIAKLLRKEGIACVELHSQLPTQVRQANLQRFSVGQVPLLLATDVAARGIDISSIKFVVQYDFPGNLPQYVHRCGRAGRSGDAAQVYSFFTRNLRSMASDTITLLETSRARVDPNLRSLIGHTSVTSRPAKKSKTDKPPTSRHSTTQSCNEQEEDDDDDDEFPELSINRIVLKRASHVSEASSDESDS